VFFVGSAVGATRTRLAFESDLHYDFEQQAITAFGGYSAPNGWSVQGAVGAILAGQLEGDEMPGTYDIEPGVVGALSASKRWSLGDGAWFVTGTGTASAAVSSTTDDSGGDDGLMATELRVGAIAGRTFGGAWSPYVLARAFAGPVSWTVGGEDVTGSDTHFFQLGAGLNVATSFGLSVVVDVAALGEQSASLGVSWQL
jgi:hypothetical protein